ncbi:FadR/GntR family transcriptional regulator [Herbaspirillum sp. RTI4]|uniref:FadR/GntR family transcriptional regulator n=1 Tax=Herbaspirillum sp. RTI4 TaxID=3048640 RepID=UPI002AB5869A|nr:FadR/GntR family transcriptional regulator [Herbaspirillum sp. RTI4]MDY7579014.1 FadR/GntR family transcriptional regulator [Herbaspirillum sp. RTI4]MEA9980945.1 FadR/GntR family transcriptional regulator [Herbaspirillum sp. RTI4]
MSENHTSTASTPSAPRKKHRNLAQGVVADISEQIQNEILKPGDKLPTESEIMRIQGVSRTVVREAISHMQAAKLVETRHGIGTFVLEPPPAQAFGIDPDTVITMRDVLAILELRISLETEAAYLAASRRNEQQLQELRAALDALLNHTPEDGDAISPDVHFHLLIAQTSGNRYFYDILHQLGTNIIPRSRINAAKMTHDDPAAYLERVNHEHEDIFNAILREDPEAARAAMRTHLSNSRERLRRIQESNEIKSSSDNTRQ